MALSTRLQVAVGLAFVGLVPLSLQFIGSESSATKGLARWEDNSAREERNSSSIAVILGEFRANFSDLMFVKTERYLHSGIAYQPHLDTEGMAATGKIEDQATTQAANLPDGHFIGDGHDHGPTTTTAVAHDDPDSNPMDRQLGNETMRETAAIPVGRVLVEDHDHDHDHDPDHDPGHDHDHVGTIIRTKTTDFRGFLGDLEREVKPWRDPSKPHIHTAGTELLPWFRVATLSNPGNERAYLIGSWWLKTLNSEPQLIEGLKFVEEGLVHNPRSFALYTQKGYIERELNRQEAALDSFKKAAELVFAERPADGKTTRDWTVHREEMAVGAWNMAIFLTRDLRGYEEALVLAKDFYARSGEPAMNRQVRNLQAYVDSQKNLSNSGGTTTSTVTKHP